MPWQLFTVNYMMELSTTMFQNAQLRLGVRSGPSLIMANEGNAHMRIWIAVVFWHRMELFNFFPGVINGFSLMVIFRYSQWKTALTRCNALTNVLTLAIMAIMYEENMFTLQNYPADLHCLASLQWGRAGLISCPAGKALCVIELFLPVMKI